MQRRDHDRWQWRGQIYEIREGAGRAPFQFRLLISRSLQGTPTALFVNNQCDIPSHFGAHNIIINLTFCTYFGDPFLNHRSMLTVAPLGGDWAGIPQFFNTLGGCPGDCNSA